MIELNRLRKWTKFSMRVARSNLGSETARPYKLNFTISKKCNSRCMNCLNWQAPNDNDLTLDEIRAFAKNASYLSWINFTGGEPTERKDIVEVVGAFIEHCPDLLFVHIPTNGINTKRVLAVAQALVELRAPGLFFTVSIDGPPAVNDKLRGIRNDFRLAVETYRRLRELSGLKVMVGMTLYGENQDLVDETVAEIRRHVPDFTYRDMHVNLPHVSQRFYGNGGLQLKVGEKMLDSIASYRRKRGIPRMPLDMIEAWYHRKAREFVRTGKTPMSCVALESSCSLSEDGTIYPCTMWDEPVGNIRQAEYKLGNLLESERKKQLRGMIKSKKCDNCWSPCEAYQTLLGNMIKVNG